MTQACSSSSPSSLKSSIRPWRPERPDFGAARHRSRSARAPDIPPSATVIRFPGPTFRYRDQAYALAAASLLGVAAIPTNALAFGHGGGGHGGFGGGFHGGFGGGGFSRGFGGGGFSRGFASHGFGGRGFGPGFRRFGPGIGFGLGLGYG